MKLVYLFNTVYLLPTVDIGYDRYYEGGLAYVELNVSWLMWSLCFSIKKGK